MNRAISRTLPLAACILLSAGPAFAGCRAGDAAARGSQAGFERAQTAAVTVSQNQTQAQTLLQKCLAGIANMPTVSIFPSLSDVFDQVVQKVCSAATQQVNSAIGQVNPNSELDKVMSGINGQVSQSTGGVITNPVSSQPVSTISQPTTPQATTTPDFWSNIWK